MLAERLTAHLLSASPAPDPVAVATRLLAVQAQDRRGMRLAIRARAENVTAAGVDRALTEDRSLVVTWLNRGTLHLVSSEDYPWLQALTAPRWVATTNRRIAQEGISPDTAERGVSVIEHALAADGPLTRAQLGRRIASADVPTRGQALIHLLALVCLRGLAVRGPVVGGEQAYALVRDWIPGGAGGVDRDAALAELARRYLAGHAPADDRDLARWSGLPLRDARAGLRAVARELVQRDDGLVQLAVSPPPAPLPPPRLLGAFEPFLLGWTSRSLVLASHEDAVVSGGIFRPFALVKGRAVATWGMPDGNVELKPLSPLTAEDTVALERDAEDVARFFAQGP